MSAAPLCPTHGHGYNRTMPVFDEKQEELEHYETMMGVPRRFGFGDQDSNCALKALHCERSPGAAECPRPP